ncbi:hypothetical protein ACLKMY_36960 [Paraburkholderia mimosarum]|uniref:hypothetical protein n=1 Tax=Paraburkholderia mimosarum TaxID=312026 RepID=UPI000413B2E1|nr:hypothetical protein [Paraburkholderia mimosarum]
MTASERIIERLREAGVSFKANANISTYLLAGEVDAIQEEAENHVRALLESLVIKPDHNTIDTARRENVRARGICRSL